MKPTQRRTVWLGAAAVVVPFAFMGAYLAATRGGSLHSTPEVDVLFLSIGLGIGCVCLWALPLKTVTKIILVLPYIAVVGGGAFFSCFWLLARCRGVGP
ncbi:MAG: hypothetical protein P1P84_04435 [Deferrisomatales bacterium]|nr:hypothetical protein [Deferrisomatales bacterium]